MFTKPLNLVLVYIITIFNIAILSSPMLAVIMPFVARYHGKISNYDIIEKLKLAFFFLIFLVSFLMLIYMFFDFLFGFSVRASLKGCKRYDKIKDYDFLRTIFKQVQERFNEKSLKLYIKNSDEINAYAVSSLGTKAIVLTSGIIKHYLAESADSKKFLCAIRSIMGHEASHLINKDFLPSFLMITNQKITNFVSRILSVIFNFIARWISFVPYCGRLCAVLMVECCRAINLVITSFNRLIVYNLYEFLRRATSRSIEYRCDRQSAFAFGGAHMAFALSFLGKSGYITIFSTHPRTENRIKEVRNIEVRDGIINPNFIDVVFSYFSLGFLAIICVFFAKKSGVNLLIHYYLQNYESVNRKLHFLWNTFAKFF
jgi:Zn-dependent protease with chaperone function